MKILKATFVFDSYGEVSKSIKITIDLNSNDDLREQIHTIHKFLINRTRAVMAAKTRTGKKGLKVKP